MKLTYYGHSAFSVQVSGKTLLFDPFIRPNARAKAIDVKALKADYILVSHGHQDHMADVAFTAQNTGATLISNFEVVQWFVKKGVSKTHALNHGGARSFDFGRVKYVNAIHSSTMPDGSSGGNPGGFVVETREGNFYYSGDTALTLDMKLIGESTPLKFAVLCIGDNFTMGVDDAIRAADFINCTEIVGCHYDTFPPIEIDHAGAIKKFSDAKKTLHLMEIGASHEW